MHTNLFDPCTELYNFYIVKKREYCNTVLKIKISSDVAINLVPFLCWIIICKLRLLYLAYL